MRKRIKDCMSTGLRPINITFTYNIPAGLRDRAHSALENTFHGYDAFISGYNGTLEASIDTQVGEYSDLIDLASSALSDALESQFRPNQITITLLT